LKEGNNLKARTSLEQTGGKNRFLAECSEQGKSRSNWGRTTLCHLPPLTKEKIICMENLQP